MSRIISPYFSLCACLLLASLASSSAFAQAAKADSSYSVLAATSAEQVRFTALGEVYQLRLEVFSAAGERLFDSDFKPGNLLDWKLQNQQGQRLAEGAYRCVVTTKSLAGQMSQKHGLLLLQAGQVTLQVPGPDAQAIQAANLLSILSQSDFLTLLDKQNLLPLTLLTHDGEQGRVVSGRGGLSFRTGDFFAGKDVEHMRLTAEGKLGLSVTDPQAKLDVGGLIRTSEGIMFPDGSVQTTAYVASGRGISERAGIQRDALDRSITKAGETTGAGNPVRLAPNGTPNRIPKYAGDGVSLVDSSLLHEATCPPPLSGNCLGIGSTTPQAGLDYRGSSASFFTRDIGPINAVSAQSALQLGLSNAGSRFAGVGPSFLFFAENSAGNKSFLGRVSGVWENPLAGAEAGAIFFQTRANSGDVSALTERMRITAAGKVGIGTQTPSAKLEVISESGNDGVASYSTSTSGNSFGVFGFSASSYGVYGHSNKSGSSGVYGYNSDGNGIYGESNTGSGVRGISNSSAGVLGSSSSGIGVLGLSTGSAPAGQFNGKMLVFGNTGIGTFTPTKELSVNGFIAVDHEEQNAGALNNGTASSHGLIFGTGTSGEGIASKRTVGGDQWGLDFYTNYTRRLAITNGGTVKPGIDNGQNLGTLGARWSNVFAANGTIVTSDERLKKAITNLGYGLSQVMQLRPVSFQWKDRDDGRTYLGLLAQEVEQIVPEAIEKDTDPATPLGMNYASLVPILIKAVQEQQTTLEHRDAKLKAIQNENAILKERQAELEARLVALEQALQHLSGQQDQTRLTKRQ
jgi:hypothetical protein